MTPLASCLSALAWKFLSEGVSQPTGQLLMTLNEAIAESFSYRRRAARGTQTPSETIRSQNGSCRDLALLMMEGARSLGFAARFVTGYIYVPDEMGRYGLEAAQPTRGARFTCRARAGLSSILLMGSSEIAT